MARQLIEDYRSEHPSGAGVGGDSAALATLVTWRQLAGEHGQQITENDLVALVRRLARMAAGGRNS
jgi:hypothetical protein